MIDRLCACTETEECVYAKYNNQENMSAQRKEITKYILILIIYILYKNLSRLLTRRKLMEAVVILKETVLRLDTVYEPVVLDNVDFAFSLSHLVNQLFQAVELTETMKCTCVSVVILIKS